MNKMVLVLAAAFISAAGVAMAESAVVGGNLHTPAGDVPLASTQSSMPDTGAADPVLGQAKPGSLVDQANGALDVVLEVYLSSAAMREREMPPARVSRSRLADLYWTPAQLVAHHTSNGCNLRPGDLLATGTVSGPARDARGCLLELTWRGAEPLRLPTGEERGFLADGDEVTMRGWCEREGCARIGLGECRGEIVGTGEVLGQS